MEIRQERPGDREAISSVIECAFASAPHRDGTEASIVECLRKAGALTLSSVAVENGDIIGHLAISPVTIEGQFSGWFGLGPVAVRPEWQNRGIGSALIRNGLQMLKEMGAAGCVLVGEPDYYARFGFIADSRLTYPGLPAEYFQALTIDGETPRGIVAYHPAFG